MAAKPKRTPERARIFGVAAHIDAGKTTVSERMLFVSGVQHRPGLVDDGTTVMDFGEEERERGITIHSAAIDLPWANWAFTLIDTPGHVDFTAEVERCMRVLDGFVLVLDASKGVEAQSETVWQQAMQHDVRPIAFLNKLDKVGADWDAALESIAVRLGAEAVSLQRPWLVESGDIRLVDLVDRTVYRYEGQTAAAMCKSADWSHDFANEWMVWRHDLIEQVAGHDEALLELFCEDENVEPDVLRAAIRRQTVAGTILPVLGGAALRGVGVEPLMDAVGHYLPSPDDVALPEASLTGKKGGTIRLVLDADKPLASQLFKVVATRHGTVSWVRVYQGRLSSGDQVRNSRTGKVERTQGLFRLAGESTESLDEALAGDVVAVKGLKDITTGDALCSPKHGVELPPWDFPLPVISMAVEARRVQDRDKLMDCLRLLATEDPTMAWRINDDTGQLLVSGMGELHLEILANKLQRDFSLDVALGKPRVAYRESIRQRARVARVVERKLPTREVRVYLDVEFVPVPTDDLPRVTHAIDEGTLDSAQARLLPDIAVESLRADLTAGFAHGFPAIQVHAVVHRVCNDEIPPPSVEDLQATLNSVVRELGKGSDTLLLEPWMAFEAQCPEGFLSSVLGDIQASGGEVHNVEAGPGHATIDARAPLSRMLDFTTRLRSLTQGRGQYSMTLDRYREVSKQDHHRLTGGV